MVMDRIISAEYILYACDDDYKLAEKICRRLEGLRLNFSTMQLKVLKAQKELLKGRRPRKIADELNIHRKTVYAIRKRMMSTGLIYYFGEKNGEN